MTHILLVFALCCAIPAGYSALVHSSTPPCSTEIRRYDTGALRDAASLIRAGQPVAVPTETVYGLAADATSAEAVARIYAVKGRPSRSEEHTSELQSLMRISSAVFCLKKKKPRSRIE